MKVCLILILISTFAYSQGDTSKVSDKIRYLDLSSHRKQEMRIWIVNFLGGRTHLLQIYYADDLIWSYRLSVQISKGLAIYEEGHLKSGEEKISEDFELLKSIPNQKELALVKPSGAQMSLQEVSMFFQTVMDGIAYKVQYWNNESQSEIRYENPETYIDILRRHNLSTSEHETFVKFIKYYENVYGPFYGDERLLQAITGTQ